MKTIIGTVFLASIIMLMIAGASTSFIDANAKHSKKTSSLSMSELMRSAICVRYYLSGSFKMSQCAKV